MLKLSGVLGFALMGAALMVAPAQAGEGGIAAAASFEFEAPVAPDSGSADFSNGAPSGLDVSFLDAMATSAAIGKVNAVAGATRDGATENLTSVAIGSGAAVDTEFNPAAASTVDGAVETDAALAIGQANDLTNSAVTPGIIELF